eukprot:CAMPEP_0202966984 /NCGR_PEP_ID=MMETSP1396-20130829/11690_1 /ASSEMBLY_ACC=CAM_ASM_000872 /TAXON_ID= /ORGANISM="Pseudokeronopsis sp., Strain Brazil" /LENGTH=63 /DNA_ID=CAMNT_0049691521 /DNA_START=347 /DNA_END=534 /DNA_ORIENTATION=-
MREDQANSSEEEEAAKKKKKPRKKEENALKTEKKSFGIYSRFEDSGGKKEKGPPIGNYFQYKV